MAGGIKKKDRSGWIGGDRYEKEKEPISYCPHCLKHQIYEILGSRILKPGEVMTNEEYEKWKQCVGCGIIYPIYEAKTESKLEDLVETTDNPFDQGKTITGNWNKVKLTPRQKEIKRLKDEADKQKDPEIRAALKRGCTVEIIEDGTEQTYLS